jgi:hypothetical protein
MEAPNSIKFQSIDNTQLQSVLNARDIDEFNTIFKSKSANYKPPIDYTPQSPKKDTTWLEYSNGYAESTDDALNQLNQMKQKKGAVLLKFSNITKQNTGIHSLFKGLEQQPNVKHLIVRHSSLSQQMIKNIERVLQLNDGIAWLVLDHNEIDDAGATDIANGLKDNDQVEHVVLSHNQIGNDGANAIANMMQSNHSFKTLFLHNNQISDAGIQALAEGIQKRPPLDVVDIRNNPISEGIKQAFQTHCDRLGIRCYS